jgi:hypothetical protein
MGSPPRSDASSVPGHRVFILWAHKDRRWSEERVAQYKKTVIDFARLLDGVAGLHVEIDAFHYDEKGMDFTRWGPLQVADADTVLMISSDALWERWSGRNPPNEGAGAAAETDALHGLFNRDQEAFQEKVLIVVLPGGTEESVPDQLSRIQRRKITELSLQGMELLLRRLLDKPRVPRRTEKTVPDLPPYPLPEADRPDGLSPGRGTPEYGGSEGVPEQVHRVPESIQGMPEPRTRHLATERTRRSQGSTRSQQSGTPDDRGPAGNTSNWTRSAVVDHEALFGIDTKLERLGAHLGNNDGDWIISIFGSPGAGKTTLAYETVKQHAARTGYRRVAWVSAKSEFLTSLGTIDKSRRSANNWRDMLLEIGAQLDLGILSNPMTAEEALARSLKSLADDERCLVVIDNLETVEDVESAIQYIEHESIVRPHKVLLTTRSSVAEYSQHGVREVAWHGLDSDASRMYAQYLWQDDPDLDLRNQDLDEIVAASGGLPLLVKLIIKLAMFERQTIADIVGRMRDSRVQLGATVSRYLYGESLTALASKDGVGEDAAVRIMNVFCTKMGGEFFTSEEFYRQFRREGGLSVETFERAKAAACQLALVRSFAGNTRFTVHSLLREFVC